MAQVDTDHEVIVVGTPVGSAEIRATPGRELDSVCFIDVVDILRGREAASDVNVVVVAPEQIVVPEVEVLHDAVACDSFRFSPLEPPPGITRCC
ncbi:hypothetical protein [Streptomyces sp. NPDC050564]|uniref:hypothetical protein n=1 Tax=Streptomyces sp. NPDC050564 TaxID=3365631 RepID=UPI0037A19810